MAIRPKTVTKARGVGTAQAVRESDSESPAAAHKYVSFNAPEKDGPDNWTSRATRGPVPQGLLRIAVAARVTGYPSR